jgi:23S rRNA G2445 N2-methylase RlmL
MEEAVATGIQDRFQNWRRVEDDANLEFWIQQAEKKALVSLRLSDRTMRHRTYKIAHLPGSLRPTIARALVYLSAVEDGDTFLDPMCGAGTILIERAMAGRHKMLIGGDISQDAIDHTKVNFGNRHKPWDLRQWDAGQMPLEDGTIDKVVSNLPWGRQYGSRVDLGKLYSRFLSEVTRVQRVGARGVFLVGAWSEFRKALSRTNKLRQVKHLKDIFVLGRRADILVLEKSSG